MLKARKYRVRAAYYLALTILASPAVAYQPPYVPPDEPGKIIDDDEWAVYPSAGACVKRTNIEISKLLNLTKRQALVVVPKDDRVFVMRDAPPNEQVISWSETSGNGAIARPMGELQQLERETIARRVAKKDLLVEECARRLIRATPLEAALR